MDSVTNLLTIVVSLGFVVGLMWLLGYLVRRYGERLGLPVTQPLGRNRRLQQIEVLPLDGRNKIVIFRRDNTQHVVLIGPESAILIEKDIPNIPALETK